MHSPGFGVDFLPIVRLLHLLDRPQSIFPWFLHVGEFMGNAALCYSNTGGTKLRLAAKTCLEDDGQSIIEYTILLGIILILILAPLRLFEVNALTVVAKIAKSIM